MATTTIDQLKSLFKKAKKKALDATTIDEKIGQGLSNLRGNVKALTNPETRKVWINADAPVSNAIRAFSAPAQQLGRGIGGAIRSPFDLYFNSKNAQIDQRLQNTLKTQQANFMKVGDIGSARDRAGKIANIGQQTANRQIGIGQQLQSDRKDAALGTVRTGIQLLGAKGLDPKSLLSTTALSGGIGYGATRLFGGSNQQALNNMGSSLGNAITYRGINKISDKLFTNPIMSRVAPGNMGARVGFGAGVNALANLGEDEVLARVEGKRITNTDRAISLATGAAMGGVSQAIQTKQYLKIVDKERNKLTSAIEKALKEKKSSKELQDSFNKFVSNYDEPISKLKRRLGVQTSAVIKRISETAQSTGKVAQSDIQDLYKIWADHSGSPRLAVYMTPEEIAQDLWKHGRKTYNQGGYVNMGEDVAGMPTVKLQEPVVRGDITKLQNNLDETLGTKSFNNTGKWKADLPARATAKKQLEYYAEQGEPEAKKLLDYVNKLENDIATAQTSKINLAPQPTKGVEPKVLRHFTSQESAQALRSGSEFDFSRKPIHGTGGKDFSDKTGKFVNDGKPALYLSLDDNSWKTSLTPNKNAQVVDAQSMSLDQLKQFQKEGGTTSFNYDTQKWEGRKNAFTKAELDSVDYEIAPNARTLVIDSPSKLSAVQKEIGKHPDSPEFWSSLRSKYDVVELRNVRKSTQVGDENKTAQRFFSGAKADQAIVLNPGVANINQATAPKGVGAVQRVPIKSPEQTQSLDQSRVVSQGQVASSPTRVKIKVQPVQPVSTQPIPVRAKAPVSSLKRSIPNNPIRDDITGVKPSGIVTKLREVVQDNWIRVKNLQRQKGVKVTESSNPYLAEELYHGRVGTRIENVKSQVVDFDKDLLSTSKKINVPDAKLKADVNKYLQAKHAPERNKIHGDGAAGMTNAEATAYLKEIENSPVGAEVKRLSSQIKQMNDETLDVLLESQVIDKKLYDTLRTTYKNHVPLNRIMEDQDIGEVLVGKGFNVKSSGVKKAKGSQREVADILGNVVANLESAIVRAEKNRVNLATLKFARNNPQIGIFSEIKPKAIGETFDGKIMTQEVKDPLVLSVRENGKPVYLKINDEKLAPVFQGIGNEKLPSAFKFIQKFTQFYSGLHTRFNPEFAASNVIRDTQEMAVFMASQKDIGFKGAGKTITRMPQAQKAVVDSMRGIDSEGARLYKQMRLDGGTTGGMALSTRKAVELDLKQIEQLNRSKPRQAVQKLLETFDNWNTIFEDATRLSVYKQALENGMSRQQAASLAKNSTVNFNKKGTATPIINSLYMFSNASVQGSVKMLRAMKDPKVAAAVVTTVGAATFAVNNWNDQIDPDWRDKVRDWDRNSNMVVMLPSTDGGAKYITIPMSWGIKPIKVAADVSYDLATGKANNIQDAAIKIAESGFDAYNPVGGEDLMSAATPTILDMPSDIARNRSWAGGNIKPDWLKGLPASEQMFANTGESNTGKIAIKTTEGLAKAGIQVSPNDLLYAYNSIIGGVGKSASRTANTVSAIATGEPLVAKEIPFANRFYKTATEEQVQKSILFRGQDNFIKSLQKYETGSETQKEAIRNYLRGLGSDQERQSILFKLRDQGIDTKGISYSGKKLGAANVPLKSDKVSFQQTDDMPQNILEKVALAAKGIGVDPENTIKAIFTQEELRKIEGNAVILKRQEFLNKANDPSLELDHIIPLALGGDNSGENLKYIPKEYHAAKTKNDNRLIKELQSGKTTKEEATEQVNAWLENNPHETYVMESEPSSKSEDTTEGNFINRDFEIDDGVDKDGEPKTKTIKVEVPEYPILTGKTEVDKKLKSSYYSKLTTAKNNTLKLYEAGVITAEQAEEILGGLDTKQKKASAKKGKKAKKIKLGSTPTLKRVSIKAPRVAQMARIDFKIPTATRLPVRKVSTTKPRINLRSAGKRLLSVVR